MTTTAVASSASRHAHTRHGRRSPNVTVDPLWIDEMTFTRSEIRRARERNVPGRRRP